MHGVVSRFIIPVFLSIDLVSTTLTALAVLVSSIVPLLSIATLTILLIWRLLLLLLTI